MNLSESIKYVLKNKKKSLFSPYKKEDLKNIFKEVPANLISFTQKSNKALRKFSLKESLGDIKSSIQGSVILMREIPQRLNDGFKLFVQDFVLEMDKLPDPKQRTVFCMKVLAGLSKLAISSAYDMGLGDMKSLGFGKSKVTYSRKIAGKLIFRGIQGFIIRLIQEVEKEMTNQDEKNQLENFKNIVLDDSGNAIDKFFEGIIDPDDRAFGIVEGLKRYILTGQRIG